MSENWSRFGSERTLDFAGEGSGVLEGNVEAGLVVGDDAVKVEVALDGVVPSRAGTVLVDIPALVKSLRSH